MRWMLLMLGLLFLPVVWAGGPVDDPVLVGMTLAVLDPPMHYKGGVLKPAPPAAWEMYNCMHVLEGDGYSNWKYWCINHIPCNCFD